MLAHQIAMDIGLSFTEYHCNARAAETSADLHSIRGIGLGAALPSTAACFAHIGNVGAPLVGRGLAQPAV